MQGDPGLRPVLLLPQPVPVLDGRARPGRQLPVQFLGWEGVGFCSYGLVGFWFQRQTAAVAAKKAFVTNRVGDFGFLMAMFLMFAHFSSFNYSTVLGTLSHGHATGLLAAAPGAIRVARPPP